MKKSQYLESLENLGLNEAQARVYFATLVLGSSPVQKIAQQAGINRSTTYAVIDSLAKLGLVMTEVHGTKRRFVAASPELLEKTLELRMQKFEKVLPDFMELYEYQSGSSLIRYVEGVEGVREAMDMILSDVRPGDDWVYMVRASGYRQLLGADWIDDFAERRSRVNINLRGLFQEESYAHTYKQFEGAYHFQMKVLPEHVHINTSQSITPQHTLIVPLREPLVGIIIDDKEVINTHQQTFGVLWESV